MTGLVLNMTGLVPNMTEIVQNITGFDFFFNHMGPAQPGLLVLFLLLVVIFFPFILIRYYIYTHAKLAFCLQDFIYQRTSNNKFGNSSQSSQQSFRIMGTRDPGSQKLK